MKRISTGPLAAAFVLALTAACSILPKSEPVQLLDPQIPAPEPASHSAGWSLNVALPESDPLRDSDQVLVRTAQGRMQVHASAHWTAAAPELLRTVLVRHLRDEQRLEQVGAGLAGLDRTLALDLRRFELVERGTGALDAQIRLEARLYDGRSGKLLARRLFASSEPVDDAAPDEIIAGFEVALGEIVPALSAWVVDQGDTAGAAAQG